MRVAAQAPLIVIFVVVIIVLWVTGTGRKVGLPKPNFVGKFPFNVQNV